MSTGDNQDDNSNGSSAAKLDLDQYRKWIEQGRVDEVLKSLEGLSLKKAVPSKSFLSELLPVLRRAGAYDEALKLLKYFDEQTPERELEEALLLGELGATESALKKIQTISFSQSSASSPQSLEAKSVQRQFDLAFHIGNFQSVARNFEASAETFAKLVKVPGLSELQIAIAELNFLGARVYQFEPDPKLAKQLSDLSKEMRTKSFFALEQGCYYFMAYAHHWAGRDVEAKEAIHLAFGLGLKHRLRESLMLDLLAIQIGASTRKPADLRPEVLAQAHAIYWDQLNLLEGTEGSLASLLLHNPTNAYRDAALSSLRVASPFLIRLTSERPELLKPSQVLKFKESLQFPVLEAQGKQISLPKVMTEQNSKILETLLRRQNFGMREAELWEKVWGTNFSESSPDAIRKSIERLRKTPEFENTIEIRNSGRRYFAAPLKSAKIIFQNS